MQILNRYLNTFISLLLIATLGCSSKFAESIDTIILPDNQHLEDTISGWWIKDLGIRYDNELFLTKNISKRLEQIGELQDVYTEKKGVYVKRWYAEGHVILEKLYHNEYEGYTDIGIELLLSEGGIPFQTLIGEKAFELKNDRIGITQIEIKSKWDNCRLFLNGYGKYCTEIFLISGA